MATESRVFAETAAASGLAVVVERVVAFSSVVVVVVEALAF